MRLSLPHTLVRISLVLSLVTSVVACGGREDGTPIGTLAVSPAGPFSAAGPAGGPFTPDRQTIRVSAEGAEVRWRAESSETWLDVVPASGVSLVDRPAAMSLAIGQAAYGLAPGRYEAQITLTNVDDSGDKLSLSVSLDVGVATTLMTVTPTVGLSAQGETGGPFGPAQIAYTLEARDGNLNWAAETEAEWLTILPAAGTVQSGQRINVNVNINATANDLEEGVYSSLVTFRNLTNPADPAVTRPAQLTVDAPVAMTVGPPEGFNSSGDEGGPFMPVAKTYRLRAQGADIEYLVEDNLDWLDINPSSGVIARGEDVLIAVRINASANALGRGNYQGALTFTNLTNGVGNTTRPVVLTVALPPAAFDQTLPADETANVALRPSFEWQDSLGATTYRLEIATGPGFANVVYSAEDIPGTSFTIDQDLVGGDTYYWRVTAINAIGETLATNAPFSFTTGVPPAPFVLSAPADAATGVLLTPSFTWTASGAVDSYELTVATDAALANVVVTDTNIVGTNHTLSTPLTSNTTYFWSVDAVNVAGRTTASNAPLSFTTGAAPGPFTLSAPADQSTDLATTPSFSWTAAPGAASYRLEVASDLAFTSIVGSAANLTQTNATLAAALPAGASLYWRVFAINPIGQVVATNAPFSFTTAGQGPGPFTLTAPVDGATQPALPLVLNWTDATLETSYTAQIATEAAFTNIVVDSGNLAADVTSFAVPPGTLIPGTTYFWRVTATNAGGNTVASNAPFDFVVSDFSARYPFTAAVQEAFAAPRTGGGAVLTGHVAGQGRDAWIFGVNASGGYLYQFTLAGAANDIVTGIIGTADGGALVSGYTLSTGAGGEDGWLVRSDGTGAVLQQRVFGLTGADRLYAARPTADGGYVAAGYTQSAGAGGDDAWVMKLDANMASTWSSVYGGAGADQARDVRSTSDGGYVVVGQTNSFGGAVDAWLLKLAANGAVSFENRYGGPGDDGARVVRETSDGGFAVAGFTRSFGAGPNGELWVFKVDSGGTMTWQRRFGGTTNTAVAASLATTADDGLLVTVTDVGSTLIKLNAAGAIVFQRRLGTAETPKSAFEAAGRIWLSSEDAGPPTQPKLWNLRTDGTPFGAASTLSPVDTATTAVPTAATVQGYVPVTADSGLTRTVSTQVVTRQLP